MARTPLEPVNPLVEEEITIVAEGEPLEEPVTLTDNIAESLDERLLSGVGFSFWHWALMLAMPILVAVIAMNTAKVTVTRNIARIL